MRRRSSANEKGDGQSLMYTINEAADYLGAPLNTVKEWRKKGKFPKATGKTARGWDLWTLGQLRDFLAERFSGKTT